MQPQIRFSRRSILAAFAATAGAAALQASPGAARSAASLIGAARRQVGVTRLYDSGYTALTFPGGDVPRERGVCTDVIVRAYRDAFGIDLQALVNADMRRNFAAYPRGWGLRAPDRNIDHRRVPNLAAFFTRQNARLPIPNDPRQWRAGDIFTSLIGGRLPHIGIVSDRRSGDRPGFVIHNIGRGAHEELALFDHTMTGRFRYQLQA